MKPFKYCQKTQNRKSSAMAITVFLSQLPQRKEMSFSFRKPLTFNAELRRDTKMADKILPCIKTYLKLLFTYQRQGYLYSTPAPCSSCPYSCLYGKYPVCDNDNVIMMKRWRAPKRFPGEMNYSYAKPAKDD
ncbi:hypothetical protein L596_026806 [Steinernema carpocapsae]|uniref:Uncharacterized protein n=1 Tax=Steinernema carpocapsae TaxID=34508 RepID=A0A4U5M2F0_STECR|nr:hypothetical protein L596_026806 [Steinernema carpocapsae]